MYFFVGGYKQHILLISEELVVVHVIHSTSNAHFHCLYLLGCVFCMFIKKSDNPLAQILW